MDAALPVLAPRWNLCADPLRGPRLRRDVMFAKAWLLRPCRVCSRAIPSSPSQLPMLRDRTSCGRFRFAPFSFLQLLAHVGTLAREQSLCSQRYISCPSF